MPNVIDLGTHQASWHKSLHQLLLAAGSTVWVSHWSAAWLHQFLDVGRPVRHDVLVLRGGTDVIRGVQLRSTKAIGADEVSVVDGLACTSRARTLLDIAATTPVDDLERIALDQVRRDRSFTGQIYELLDRYRKRPGRGRLVAAFERLPDDASQLGSPLEVRGVQALLTTGVVPGQLQFEVRDNDGRFVKRVDVAWPQSRTIVEFDGATYHDPLSQKAADEQVRHRLRSLGWTVFVVRARDLDGPNWAALARQIRVQVRKAEEPAA